MPWMGDHYIPFRKSYEVICYQYEAGHHCLSCAEKRYGPAIHELDFEAEDREGNPVHPVFLDDLRGDEFCDDCLETIE